MLALFSHELQNDPTSRIFYCIFAIGFYIFCIVLSLVDLKHEKNVRALFPTKCKELGYIAIGISTVGIIVSIVLIVVSLL